MNSFFDRMLILRDLAASKAVEYGISKIRKVFIRQKKANNVYEIIQVTPIPLIEEIKHDLENIGDLSNLKGMSRLLEVKGISKSYSRHILEAENTDYLVDSIDNTPDAPQWQCNLLSLTDNGLTWQLQLQQDYGQQEIYLYE